MAWWIRPLVRIIAAVLLPLVIPAVLTGVLWALPGDPAEILCPPGICDGTADLARRFHLDEGPSGFYLAWLQGAAQGDFGNSWRVYPGITVSSIIWESIPVTSWLIVLAMLPLLAGSFATALGWLPARLDAVWQGIGLVPAVILSLVGAAVVVINYGALSYEGFPGLLRLLIGALVLGIADGALAGAIIGTRSVFVEEVKQRYILIAMLRGETVLSNAMPNVLPALVGQMRSRLLQLLSGAVVVEVVLEIPGLGELLWDGTLLQDFGVVLAAAWGLSLLSGVLLVIQAAFEIAVAMRVRYSPKVPA